MSKPILFVTSHIFIASVSFAAAAPQDSPGTVYIDGLPCNSACQPYMAWSRQASGQRPSSPPSQPIAAQKLSVLKVLSAKRNGSSKPAPVRVAMQPKPKRAAPEINNSNQPARNASAMQAGTIGAKPGSAESIPTPMPDPRPNQTAGTSPAQMTTFPPAAVPLAQGPQAKEPNAAPASTSSTKAPAATNPNASGRVMDGEVPADVITVVSPEEAAMWTDVPGYTVLRLPLAPSREKASPS